MLARDLSRKQFNHMNILEALYKSLAIGSISLVAACAPPLANVKNINSNLDGYMASNYSEKNIAPGVAAVLSQTTPPLGEHHSEIKVVLDHQFKRYGEASEKAIVTKPVVRYRPIRGPFVQELRSVENDGVPVDRQLVLSYLGFLTLKRQALPNQGLVGNSNEIKSIEPFKWFGPNSVPGSSVAIRYKIGTIPQMMNFQDGVMTCTLEKTIQASNILPNIKGIAQFLDCNFKLNNSVGSKSSVVYLPTYGISVTTALTVPGGTYSDKIVEFIASP